jgi:hypothetical protein
MRVQAHGLIALLAIVVTAAPSGGAAQTQLPPGHPPTAPRQGIPGPPPGAGTGAAALRWTAPPHWVSETPTSSMRRAQYRIPGKGGEAECVVFYFGPGQGGDAQANAQRWGSQFTKPDGSTAAGALKTREIKVGDMPAMLVEVAGTYVGGMGTASAPKPDSMLLGAIVDGPDARWFFRAVGPRTTLEGERATFEKMIRSIRRGTT